MAAILGFAQPVATLMGIDERTRMLAGEAAPWTVLGAGGVTPCREGRSWKTGSE